MSDSARRIRRTLARMTLAALTMAPMIAPTMARAQSAADLRARLVASARQVAILKDSLSALHEMRTADLPTDSLNAGALRFRFLKTNFGTDLQATLKTAAAQSMRVADSIFGDEADGVAGTTPILATRAVTQFGPVYTTASIVSLEIADGGGRSNSVRAPVTPRKLEDVILDLLGTMATRRVPEDVVAWGGQWIPSRRIGEDDWQNAAVDLASSSAVVSRSCYSGSVPACESALGLTLVHDPLAEWYTPDGWRVLVSSWKPSKDSVAMVADRVECIEKNVAAACERLARSRPVPIPVTVSTRQTLFGLALERGGRQAYSRLINAKGSRLEVLSIAAGLSPDSLIREWRTRVIAAAPKSASPTPLQATVLVAWVLVLGFAAGRRRP
jgi:hypothetical protein